MLSSCHSDTRPRRLATATVMCFQVTFFVGLASDAVYRNVAAQEQRPARVTGKVVAVGEASAPAGLTVTLVSTLSAVPHSRRAAVDSSGHYTFRGVPPGTYLVSIQPAAVGDAGLEPSGCNSGRRVTVRGQDVVGVNLYLERSGSLSGRVRDREGRPVVGVTVSAAAPDRIMRKDRLTVSAGSAQTDSLGRYHILGLKADTYYVYACPPPFCTTDADDRHMRGALTFHPSARDLDTASRVSILPAGEISDVDIVVEWPATYDLTGLVVDGWGRPRGDLPVLLFPGSDVWIAVSAHATTAPNGRFRLEGIPAGTYVLQSGSGVKVDHPVFAAAIVNVSEDSRDFVLHATEGGTITGDIVFEASGVDFTPNQLAIAVRGEDFSRTPVAPLGGASVTIDDDWTLQATNVWGPHKLEVLEVPTGWMLKAVESQGIDHTDRTVDPNSSVRVTFTQRVSGIAGTVLDGKGKLVPGATVIVFSTDSAHWELPSRRVRRINSDTSAHFALRLPPGDYYALAVECLPDDRMFRSDVLQNLASHATVITVREGRTEPAALILY